MERRCAVLVVLGSLLGCGGGGGDRTPTQPTAITTPTPLPPPSITWRTWGPWPGCPCGSARAARSCCASTPPGTADVMTPGEGPGTRFAELQPAEASCLRMMYVHRRAGNRPPDRDPALGAALAPGTWRIRVID